VVIASEWVSAKIPKEISLAIDRYLATKSAQINGVHSRSDFLTRLCVAWFANVEKEFSLFDSSRVSEIFGRTHPPPIHPSELLNALPTVKKPTRIYDSRIEFEKAIKALSFGESSLPVDFQNKLQELRDRYDDFITDIIEEREEEQRDQPPPISPSQLSPTEINSPVDILENYIKSRSKHTESLKETLDSLQKTINDTLIRLGEKEQEQQDARHD
jgi:hypothetical protein